jgi:hypothetical protein
MAATMMTQIAAWIRKPISRNMAPAYPTGTGLANPVVQLDIN